MSTTLLEAPISPIISSFHPVSYQRVVKGGRAHKANIVPLRKISLLVPFRMLLLILRMHCLRRIQDVEANVTVNNLWIVSWYPEQQAQTPGVSLSWCSRGTSKSSRAVLQDKLGNLSFSADWAPSVVTSPSGRCLWDWGLVQNDSITSQCDSGRGHPGIFVLG